MIGILKLLRFQKPQRFKVWEDKEALFAEINIQMVTIFKMVTIYFSPVKVGWRR